MATSSTKAISDTVKNQNSFTCIKDIKVQSDHCIIKVKIVRMWKSFFNDNPRIPPTLDMIIMDEQGYKIIATVTRKLVRTFESVLKEGGFFIISNFRVATYSSTPALVDHAAKIIFFQDTIVDATAEFPPPDNEYNFVNFDDVKFPRVNKNIAFDIIGRLVSSNDMKIIKGSGGKEKHLLTCELQNLSGEKLHCTLWQDYAKQLHKFILDNQNSNDPIIVFLHFAKYNDYYAQGKVGISNMICGTRLYINENVDPILNFKESMAAIENESSSLDIGVQLSTNTVVTNTANYFNDFDAKHIYQILQTHQPLDCVFVAKIIKIEDDEGWFYMACRKCTTKVEEQPVGSTFPYDCDTCKGVSDVYPRMRLYVRVEDETGNLSIKMFDRELENLINKTSRVMHNQMTRSSNPAQLPADFNMLLNKRFLFKIRVTKWNIDHNYNIFNVNRLTDDEDDISKVLLRLKNPEDITSEADTPISIMDVSHDNNDSKEVLSVTADNGPPIDQLKSTAETHGMKRHIEDTDPNINLQSSTSKSLTFTEKLKIPKLEKN